MWEPFTHNPNTFANNDVFGFVFFSDDLIKSSVNVYYSLLITGKPSGFVRIV